VGARALDGACGTARVLRQRPGRAVRARPAPDPPGAGPIPGRLGACHATGELALPDGSSFLVASVHGRATVASARGTAGLDRAAIARPSVGEPWWNDVAFAGDRELVEGHRFFLLGGDWNTSRRLDADAVPTPAGADFFARSEAAGWVELSLDADGREGKTWYGSTNPRTRQPDHLFADPTTAAARPGPDRVDIPSAPSSRRPRTRRDVRSCCHGSAD